MQITKANQHELTQLFTDYQTNSGKARVLDETQQLFHQLLQSTIDYPKKMQFNWRHWNPFTKIKTDYSFEEPLAIGKDGQVTPSWFSILEREELRLKEGLREEVSVVDFGAVGDGVTDSTKAFKQALASGRRKVTVPSGVFIIKELKIDSTTLLSGVHSTKTILKLHPDAPKSERLIRNRRPIRGNHHIKIENLTLDWNVERLPANERTASGGTASSGITLAHVKYAWVQNVVIQNPGLHGIDVTASSYSYLGDGTRSRRGSDYIWLDQIEAFGYGDDGITTHHSQHVFISHSYLHHPSGRAHASGFSNSNGIEVDDGSEHVSLVENRTAYGFGGIEIKAHETSSAASDTQIFGHISFHDNRAYNFRHIGHHKGEDALTRSACGIRGSFLVADSPQPTNLYIDSTPRCLVVSAYQQVVVNHFIGKNQLENVAGNLAIAVQYRARNVTLNQINLVNYGKLEKAIRISKDAQNIQWK